LERFQRAEDARALATQDDAGNYRPLKSAPTLRRGWLLSLADVASLRRALDYFYPAAIGEWLALCEGRLRATSLRQTVSRQTGMYRVTGKITTAQADELAGENCASAGGCLRTILWKIEDGGAAPSSLPPEKFAVDFDQTGAGERVIPLLCAEMCNVLVAAARAKIKSAPVAS
jgi:sirohydrochlorin cobaltochelatase